jgi:dienelactone hydrolase
MKKPSSENPAPRESGGVSRRTFLAGAAGGAIASACLARVANAEPARAGPASVRTDLPLRDRLLQCLGGEWPAGGPLDVRTERSEPKEGYRLERITYLVEPQERIAAYLLIPDGADAKRPAPGICVWHQHAGQYEVGKDEPAGVHAPNFGTMHMTGVALAREGYVVLCPDAAGFGERNRPPPGGRPDTVGVSLERYLFSMYVVAGQCLAWKNIFDMQRAVDLLAGRPEVCADRIGCYGHSMGSTHTWLVGPWEPRIRALVGNCCMPTYAAMERTGLVHCFPNYVPGWRAIGDIPDIVGLIAPRALHLNFGETDDGSPIREVREAMPRIRAAYAAAGAEDRFSFFIEESVGHELSPEMWRRTREHFARHLRA